MHSGGQALAISRNPGTLWENSGTIRRTKVFAKLGLFERWCARADCLQGGQIEEAISTQDQRSAWAACWFLAVFRRHLPELHLCVQEAQPALLQA